MIVTLNILVYYNEKYFQKVSFCVITHPIGQNGRTVCKSMHGNHVAQKHGNHVAIADKSWIRVLDTPSCYGRAAPPSGRIEAKDVRPSVRPALLL